MLRRIHAPERGASFLEYSAVIVLAAAIVAAVVFTGLPAQISTAIDTAVEAALGGEGAPGDGGDGSDPPADAGPGPGQNPPADDPPGGPGDQSGDDPPANGGQERGDDNDGGQDDDGGGPASNDDPAPVAEAADDGGGVLDTLWDGATDIGTGVWDAGADFVGSVGDGVSDAIDSGRRLLDDPAQWASDTWDDTVETATNTWDGITSDPLGFGRDFLFSDEVQQDWADGDRLHAGSQAVAENLIGFIPYVGWAKKTDRINDIANAGGRGDRPDNDDGPVQADGDDGRPRDEEDDNSPSCALGSSFVPGTPVLLADGTHAPIEDIEVGDQVWAFDPATGAEGPRPVTDLITSAGTKTLVDVTVDDGTDTGAVLTATHNHPFWVPEQAAWVEAVELEPGTWLRTSAGTWTQTSAVETRTAPAQRVHNLTIADPHTYYVALGEVDALVHNDNCTPVRDLVTDDNGDLMGYEDSTGVRIITPQELRDLRTRLYQEYGQPTVRNVPGKGTVEVWEVDGGKINYRDFSSSGGPGDETIDFSGFSDLGMKRLHAK